MASQGALTGCADASSPYGLTVEAQPGAQQPLAGSNYLVCSLLSYIWPRPSQRPVAHMVASVLDSPLWHHTASEASVWLLPAQGSDRTHHLCLLEVDSSPVLRYHSPHERDTTAQS